MKNLGQTLCHLGLIIACTFIITRFVGCTEAYNAQEQLRPHQMVTTTACVGDSTCKGH